MFEQLLNNCFTQDLKSQGFQKDYFNLRKNPQYMLTNLLNEQM